MGEPYIVRFDYSRSHGWLVKVPGQPNKLFSDSKHPDSLAAARAHRDALMEGVPLWPRSQPRASFSGNTSGTVGVSRYIDRHGKFIGWRAYASITPRKQVVIPFTFAKHGRSAKRRAVAARELLLRLHDLYQGGDGGGPGQAPGVPRAAVGGPRKPTPG
jgi:hypothetical protein